MKSLAVALFALAFLDALSTYIVITFGLGVEANSAVADIVNSNPAALFPLAAVSAAVPSAALYVAVWLSSKLSSQLRAAVMRLLTSAFLAVIIIRVAVVVNNVAVIVKTTLF
jgi:hypothetical protein